MKQYPTIKQIDELSKKGKEALWQWRIKQKIDGTYQWGRFKTLPLLSIGQMIEFLEESQVGEGGEVLIEWSEAYGDEELCDALWLAVKEVLEK